MAATETSWMRGSSPLKGALLGLILERPGHGYDLANRLDRRLGPAWRIDGKRLYPMLGQLEKAGLVSSEVISTDGPTVPRVVYSPTERANDALTDWMETNVPKEPMRVELHARIAVARAEDAPRLLAALDQYERQCFALLRASETELPQVRSWVGVAMHLARRSALGQLQAELTWIGHARGMITEFAASR
jgi:DNA-binding PadR family transcriptional regulator